MEIYQHLVFIQIVDFEFDSIDSANAWPDELHHMNVAHAIGKTAVMINAVRGNGEKLLPVACFDVEMHLGAVEASAIDVIDDARHFAAAGWGILPLSDLSFEASSAAAR